MAPREVPENIVINYSGEIIKGFVQDYSDRSLQKIFLTQGGWISASPEKPFKLKEGKLISLVLSESGIKKLFKNFIERGLTSEVERETFMREMSDIGVRYRNELNRRNAIYCKEHSKKRNL